MVSRPRMFTLLFFIVLCTSCLAESNYSFSTAVGGGSGIPFSTAGTGKITSVRVWEIPGSYITGFQLRHNGIWSAVIGRKVGMMNEMGLFDGEAIMQVSGKYSSSYIYQVMFVTSRGRLMIVGQPVQNSFNFYPRYPNAELKMLSGRHNGRGITSLAAHWGDVSSS